MCVGEGAVFTTGQRGHLCPSTTEPPPEAPFPPEMGGQWQEEPRLRKGNEETLEVLEKGGGLG